jgi:DNA ligase (NAD+)
MYEDGILIKGVSRGNGLIGEDISIHLLQVCNLPKKLNKPVTIEIRGELYIPISKFIEINSEGEYANTRNLV